MSNKVVASLSALVNNEYIPQDNNVICIDTVNNRIGVKTNNPMNEIDISGILKTNYIYLDNSNNIEPFHITHDTSYIKLKHGLKVETNIICQDISCHNINCNDLCCNNIICHDICCIDLCCNNILCNEISCNDISCINFFGISCEIYTLKGITGEFVEVLTASTGISASDDRYKHNEKPITNALNVLRQLVPQVYDKTYTFKSHNYTGIINEPYYVEAGLIAQEVLLIDDISYSVRIGSEDKPYYLKYNDIFVYGLAGIKELDKKFDILDTSINININNLSNKVTNFINNVGDISNINFLNMKNLILNQNTLIQSLNSKLNNLESRINNLENK